MNAQNVALTLAPDTTEPELTTEEYLSWLGTIKTGLESVQNACNDKFAIVQGQGGTRGPWLNSVNKSLTALLQGSLAGAIVAANEEEI